MIKIATTNPLADFVATITAMGRNREMIMSMPLTPGPGECGWRQCLEDLEVLTGQDKVVIGIRTPWVRNVAVPIVQALRQLRSKADTRDEEQRRIERTLELIKHCTDVPLRTRCENFVLRGIW